MPLFSNASACQIDHLGECSRSDRSTVVAYVACLLGFLLCCALSRMLHSRVRTRCCPAAVDDEDRIYVEPSPQKAPAVDRAGTIDALPSNTPRTDKQEEEPSVSQGIQTLPTMCEASNESLVSSSTSSASVVPSCRGSLAVEASAVPVAIHNRSSSPPPTVSPLGLKAAGLAPVPSSTQVQLELSDDAKPMSPRVSFPASVQSSEPGSSAKSEASAKSEPTTTTPRLGALGMPTDISRRASSLGKGTPRGTPLGTPRGNLRRGSSMNISMRRLEHGASSLARQVSKSSFGRQVSSSALGRGTSAMVSWASSKDFFQHDDSDDDDGLDDSGLVCNAAPITYETKRLQSAKHLLGIGDDEPLSAPGAMQGQGERQLSFEHTPRMVSSMEHCAGSTLETIESMRNSCSAVDEEDSQQASQFSPQPLKTPKVSAAFPTPSTIASTASPPTAPPTELNRLDSSRKEFLAMREQDVATKDAPVSSRKSLSGSSLSPPSCEETSHSAV